MFLILTTSTFLFSYQTMGLIWDELNQLYNIFISQHITQHNVLAHYIVSEWVRDVAPLKQKNLLLIVSFIKASPIMVCYCEWMVQYITIQYVV